MLARRLYYFAKPFLPRAAQIALRRLHASRVLRRSRHLWPINAAAGTKPANWSGWPQGKQFALVLTHDVEGQRGLERVRQLAELEMELGFRSSFNFIPEGEYDVPRELREWLTGNGFEVGVHDLHHDGSLYRSRRRFRRTAAKINQYLEDWNAKGFRSGFMLHNLEWLHDLKLSYDASTFDTDPFEPQPDGMETIFPFWVEAPRRRDHSPRADQSATEQVPGVLASRATERRRGYVELPYTLVQDFNLFIVLKETTIDLWCQKLGWIAEQGGMALLDTHPDYMSFGKGHAQRDEFPVALYADFLRYVRSTHAEAYWPALPHEVADFYMKSCVASQPVSRGRVCMISYSYYETDNRVRRYAETLVKEGYEVDAYSLRRERGQPERETLEGVVVHRLQERQKDERGALDHLTRQCRFLVSCARLLKREQRLRAYDLVHVHNPPDFMVFAAWATKQRGAKIILDIHDVVPELYGSKFKSAGVSLIVRALTWIERISMRFADHVIVSNHLWHEKLVSRSVPREKTSVLVNHVDPAVFHPRPRSEREGKFLMVFPGSLSWHQGLDIAIRAFVRVQAELPYAEFHIHGVGSAKPDLINLIDELGLREKVLFRPVVALDEVAALMANADVGVVPKRANSFGNEAYSTKIMEFMSQGTPVIASRTKIDSYYFDDSVICFFEPENVDDLASCILRVARDREYRDTLRANALQYAQQHGWDKKQHEYLKVVNDLLCDTPSEDTPEAGPNVSGDRLQTDASSDRILASKE